MKGIILSVLVLISTYLSGQKPVDILINIAHYDQNRLLLSYYSGGNVYMKDTLHRYQDGTFRIKSDTLFTQGMYVLYTFPDKKSIELILSEDQEFTVTAEISDIYRSTLILGSTDNELYQRCLQVIYKRKIEADNIKAKLEYLKNSNDLLGQQLQARLVELGDSMRLEQLAIVKEYPDNLAARYVKASKEPDPPKFDYTKQAEVNKARWYQKHHYFDNIDFSDLRHYRSPYVFNQIKFLINNYRHPDSINSITNLIIKNFSKTDASYKLYFNWLLKYYATTNMIGLDAGYVHMVKSYILQGKTPWINKADSLQFAKSAAVFERTLIGKKAPEIILPDKSGKLLSLYKMDSIYTLVYFSDPDCKHCQEALPKILEMYENYRHDGLGIFGVCTKIGNDYDKCFKYAEANMVNFPIVADGEKVVETLKNYNLTTFPAYFILDKNKKIVAKNLTDQDLAKALEHFVNFSKSKKGGL